MYDRLVEHLKATGIAFAETAWSKAPKTDYGVIAMDGAADTVWADNRMRQQALEGTVDLFTHGPGMEKAKQIQTALDEAGVSWQLGSVQFEEDTKLTHWEWIFQLEVW